MSILANALVKNVHGDWCAPVADIKWPDGTIETWWGELCHHTMKPSIEEVEKMLPEGCKFIRQAYYRSDVLYPKVEITTDLVMKDQDAPELSEEFVSNPTRRFYTFIGETIINNRRVMLESPMYDGYDPKAPESLSSNALDELCKAHPHVKREHIASATVTHTLLIPRNKLKAKYE